MKTRIFECNVCARFTYVYACMHDAYKHGLTNTQHHRDHPTSPIVLRVLHFHSSPAIFYGRLSKSGVCDSSHEVEEQEGVGKMQDNIDEMLGKCAALSPVVMFTTEMLRQLRIDAECQHAHRPVGRGAMTEMKFM